MRERPQPVLSVRSMTLRPWVAADAGTVRAAFADPDIRFWHMRSLDLDGEAEGWVAAWADRWPRPTGAGW